MFICLIRRRPQGVPYAGPKGQPPQLASPENYHKQIAGTGIVGAVIVEASPWIEDNLWILERANSDPVFVGVVGDLDPSKPDFGEYLNRFSKDPLWRGIRYARVWQMENGKQVLKPGMAEGLKLLARPARRWIWPILLSICCAARCWQWRRFPICAW